MQHEAGQPFAPGKLVKCRTCGKSTCIECLGMLKKGADEISQVFVKGKGMVLQSPPALDALLSGELLTGVGSSTGATVGKEVDTCIWCPDKHVPDVPPRIEPRALEAEIGLNPSATYAGSATRLLIETERCARIARISRKPPLATLTHPVPLPSCIRSVQITSCTDALHDGQEMTVPIQVVRARRHL